MLILEILEWINEYRKEMVDLGLTKGLTHKDTITCSQKLDDLMNHYYKLKALSKRIA